MPLPKIEGLSLHLNPADPSSLTVNQDGSIVEVRDISGNTGMSQSSKKKQPLLKSIEKEVDQ